MAETVINKNQTGSGIWTANNNPIIGNSAPTSAIEAEAVGQLYLDSSTGEMYVCTDPNGAAPQANFTALGNTPITDYTLIGDTLGHNSGADTGFSITTTGSWEIRTRLKATNAERGVFGATTINNNYNRWGAGVYLENGYQNRLIFHVNFNKDVFSWDVDVQGSTQLSTTSYYFAKFGFDVANSVYYIDLSADGSSYTRDGYVINSGIITRNSLPISLGIMNYYSHFIGEIDLRNTAIYEDGVLKYTPYTFGGSAWQKTGTNFTKVSGYSSSGTQVLKNINGVLTWVAEA